MCVIMENGFFFLHPWNLFISVSEAAGHVKNLFQKKTKSHNFQIDFTNLFNIRIQAIKKDFFFHLNVDILSTVMPYGWENHEKKKSDWIKGCLINSNVNRHTEYIIFVLFNRWYLSLYVWEHRIKSNRKWCSRSMLVTKTDFSTVATRKEIPKIRWNLTSFVTFFPSFLYDEEHALETKFYVIYRFFLSKKIIFVHMRLLSFRILFRRLATKENMNISHDTHLFMQWKTPFSKPNVRSHICNWKLVRWPKINFAVCLTNLLPHSIAKWFLQID